MKRPASLALAAAVACVLATGAPGTARQLKVAYVTDDAGPNSHDLRGAALLGFRRAVKNFRVDARVFLNTEKCRSVALSQIARSAGALFNVACRFGLGTLEAAKAKGVWGIGADVDQSFFGPHILTSVLKRFDVQAYATVRELVQGRLRTGATTIWDVRNGAVGLGPISPRVPRELVRQIESIRKQIAAGTIRVPSRVAA